MLKLGRLYSIKYLKACDLNLNYIKVVGHTVCKCSKLGSRLLFLCEKTRGVTRSHASRSCES